MVRMNADSFRSDYVEVKTLGQGAFGHVRLWKLRGEIESTKSRPRYVAVKSLPHSGEDDLSHAKMRKREVYILTAVQEGRNRNIIKCFGTFEQNIPFMGRLTCIVLEACHGDLAKFTMARRVFSEDEVRLLGFQMLHGLDYLHGLKGLTSKILHR